MAEYSTRVRRRTRSSLWTFSLVTNLRSFVADANGLTVAGALDKDMISERPVVGNSQEEVYSVSPT